MNLVTPGSRRLIAAGISFSIMVMLSACGGGGGSSPPPAAVAVAPQVTIAFANAKTKVGTADALTWTSTNATSCTGGDSLSGTQATSGMTNITPTGGGQFKYTISCTGAGGTATQSANLIVPIPIQRTSYLNFKNNGQGKTNLPAYTHAMAYGDFFQDGTISLMTSPVIANPSNPADINKTGTVHFYKNINGAWVNKTSDILSDNTGCVWPRKAVSADFNGDGKPDIFLSCTGFDAPPFAGERQVLFLSQPDGTYKRSLLNFNCYCHGSSAADFSGNGFADLAITDTSGDFKQPMYLHNNKDGTFTPTKAEIPTSAISKPIYSLEFIDINGDGVPDLFIGGIDVDSNGNMESPSNFGAWTPKVYFNHNGLFTTDFVALPIDVTQSVTLDIIVESGTAWLLKTNYVDKQFLVKQFDLKSGIEGLPLYLPNNGIFWIIRDTVKGIVTTG